MYAEVKRMRMELKSLEKSLGALTKLLIPEEKVTFEEVNKLSGECVSFEEVLRKHGAKTDA